jgi:hypothetical protein
VNTILAIPHEFAPAGFFATMRHIGIEIAHGRCRPEVAEDVVQEMARFIAQPHRGDCVAYLLDIAERWRINEASRLAARSGAIRRSLYPMASARLPLDRLLDRAHAINDGLSDPEAVDAIVDEVIASTRYAWRRQG